MELSPTQLGAADVLPQFFDSSIGLPYGELENRVKYLACFQRTVACTDTDVATNPELVKLLHLSDYRYLEEGILAPILRRQITIRGATSEIGNTADLYEKITERGDFRYPDINKDPVTELQALVGDEALGVFERIDKTSQMKKARTIRNPETQTKFDNLCDALVTKGIAKELGIETDWKSIIGSLRKDNGGIVPGRLPIYAVSRNHMVRLAAEWIFYLSLWQSGLGGHPSIGFHESVQRVTEAAIGRVESQLPKEDGMVHDLNSSLVGRLSPESFSNVEVEDLVEIREDYSPAWWRAIENPDLDPKEVRDSFCGLYGKIAHTVGHTSPGVLEGVRFLLRVFDLAVGAAGITMEISGNNYAGLSLVGGSLAVLVADYLISKPLERSTYKDFGRGALIEYMRTRHVSR